MKKDYLPDSLFECGEEVIYSNILSRPTITLTLSFVAPTSTGVSTATTPSMISFSLGLEILKRLGY